MRGGYKLLASVRFESPSTVNSAMAMVDRRIETSDKFGN